MQEGQGYHTFMDYPLSALEGVPGVLVPQHSVGSNPEPTNSIRFTSNTHAGIRLADAAVNNFGGLKNAMEPVSFLRDNANMLTFYIHWPGYRVWTRTLPLNPAVRGGFLQMPLSKVAAIVARILHQFYQEMSGAAIKSTETKQDWWLSFVPYDSLVLLEMRYVGPGAWQPVLCRTL